jgi:hypothetical protein
MISILSANLDVSDEVETLNFFHPREMEKNQKGPPLCHVIFLKSALQPNFQIFVTLLPFDGFCSNNARNALFN